MHYYIYTLSSYYTLYFTLQCESQCEFLSFVITLSFDTSSADLNQCMGCEWDACMLLLVNQLNAHLVFSKTKLL